VRDARRQDVVEGGDAVGGNEKETIGVEPVDVTNFTAGMKLEIREFSMKKNRIEEIWGHEREFYRQKTSRILAAHKFLSTIYVMDQCDDAMWLIERTLTDCGHLENPCRVRHLGEMAMWKT